MENLEDTEASRLPSIIDGSVTHWIGDLKAGDSDAATELWNRYFQRLIALAKDKLRKLNHKQAHDGEDVAQSAFISLCEGASHGRFDKLGDRDDLWRLMVVITSRKAADLSLRNQRRKRGGGRVMKESELVHPDAGDTMGETPLNAIIDSEPTPAFAAMLAEEFSKRLDMLPKAELREIALLRMQGYTNEEIAEKLGCALRTVARRLDWIRGYFKDGDHPSEALIGQPHE